MAFGLEFASDRLAAGLNWVDFAVDLKRILPAALPGLLLFGEGVDPRKIPVLIGQAKLVSFFLESAVRGKLMVVSLPLGTFFISASTSMWGGDDETAFGKLFGEFAIAVTVLG